MNLRVQKRTSHGLDFIVAYTVSKQMDNWSVGGAGVEAVDPIHFTRTGIIGGRGGQLESAYGGPWTFQDPDNRNADRAVAVDDIPQNSTSPLPTNSRRPRQSPSEPQRRNRQHSRRLAIKREFQCAKGLATAYLVPIQHATATKHPGYCLSGVRRQVQPDRRPAFQRTSQQSRTDCGLDQSRCL